ncbi:MAG: dockerin type I domain-containing protein [Planctomycetota bacterium]|jgi:hypothetical protein
MNGTQKTTALAAVIALLVAVSALAQDFDLSWYTIDGGGDMWSTGGDFELSGTIGQPDAGVMTGDVFELSGGFWFRVPPGDCGNDGNVDLFDYEEFEACLTGPDRVVISECRCFDVDHSGTVDMQDFAVIQAGFASV